MDYILIETIGVGQVELDITQVCDTTAVVLVPESGDSIQAMKAGLLEVADILVVNKGDRKGCDRLMMELKFAFDLKEQKVGWHYPILKTIAIDNQGIDKLVSTIKSHKKYLSKSKKLEENRKSNLSLTIHELIEENIKSHLKKYVINENELNRMLDKIYQRKLNPYKIANKISRKVLDSPQRHRERKEIL